IPLAANSAPAALTIRSRVLAVSTFDLRIVLGLPGRDLALELVAGQRVEGLAGRSKAYAMRLAQCQS
ncbi:MAG TPA: hypothetical protein VNO32_43920, partial [Candidatus Acidoferrum sp.]|nr:hypothetical protein [Candidatus Acidoferrum sp.]